MHAAADKIKRETEIKLLLRRQDVTRLRGHPVLWAGFENAGEPSRQESVYFDDRRRTLRREGLTLRVRQIGERRIQTIKALNGSAGPIDRGEWQADVAGTRPDLSAAAGTALQTVLPKLRIPLEPVFETRVSRTEFPVQYGNSEIVVAFDEGEIDTGKVSAPICEVELELKRGNRGDLFRLAEQLDGTVPLELSYATKSARGYALLDSPDASTGKAGNVPLRPGISLADAFRAISHDCLRHMVENRDGVMRREPEALHQMRIAIRRFHSTLSLFRHVLTGPGIEAVKAELRWLRAQTGPARDLDVFIGEVMVPIRGQHPKEKAVVSLHQHLRRRRLKAYTAAREAVMSARFRRLAVQTAAWVEDGDWHANVDALMRARQDAPVEAYAAARLSALHRKVRKRGKRLREFDHEGRHRLRVQAKKLRYAAEFLAGLATGKKARKRAKTLIAALKEMQDKLGGLNDIAVRKSLSAEIAGKVGPGAARKQSGRERIFVAGLIAGHQEAHVSHLLDEAAKAFAQLRKVKPFWKGLARESVPVPAWHGKQPEAEVPAPVAAAKGADHVRAETDARVRDAESKAA
jgi:inorganic triphosphatase YgiF